MSHGPAIPVAELHEVGKRLQAAGYDEPSLAAALGLPRLANLRRSDLPLYERRVGDTGPLAVLTRVFLFGQSVDRAALGAILSETGVEALTTSGLVADREGQLAPIARLTPFAGLIFAHDAEKSGTMAADHVIGIGPAAKLLHTLTVRAPAARALDVGTGCGVQALCLARHARHVVATDVNPRALWFGRCNAVLNGIQNIEWREGSLLEPIAGETFDLVVANPPFVISPDAEFVFRDAGGDGDICRILVSEVGQVLNPGGFAQALINWKVTPDEGWDAEPQRWTEGTGCDAWLLYHRTEDGLAYAAKWNSGLREIDPARFAATLDRWTAYYAEHGIAGLASGAIMLRRRPSGSAWWRADQMVTGPQGDAGEQVRRVFRAQDRLRGWDDDALLTMTPRFAGAHRLDQRLRYHDGAYAVEHTQILLNDGVGVAGIVDPQALLVLLAIDGRQTLAQLLAGAVDELSAEEAAARTTAVVMTVRHLSELGIITVDGVA